MLNGMFKASQILVIVSSIKQTVDSFEYLNITFKYFSLEKNK